MSPRDKSFAAAVVIGCAFWMVVIVAIVKVWGR